MKESKAQYLDRVGKIVRGCIQDCLNQHGSIDPGSLAKRITASLWGHSQPDGHPDLGRWMKHRRGELDLSQSELAAKLGTTQVQISKWESGRIAPGSEWSRKIQEALC